MLHQSQLEVEDGILSGLQVFSKENSWQIVIENNQLRIEKSSDAVESPIDSSIFGDYRVAFSGSVLQLFHTSERAPISQFSLESVIGDAKEKSLCWLNQYTIVLCFCKEDQLIITPVSLLNQSKSSNVPFGAIYQ